MFKDRNNLLLSVLKYYALVLVILFFNTYLLSFFVHICRIPVGVAKLATEAILFVVNLIVQRLFVFRRKQPRNPSFPDERSLFSWIPIPIPQPLYIPLPAGPRKSGKLRTASRQKPVWVLVAANLAATGVCLCIFALFHHVIPVAHKDAGTVITRPPSGGTLSATTLSGDSSADDAPVRGPDLSGWGAKFAR